MSATLIARKDLAVLFRSSLAWVVLACFLLVTGYFFAASVGYYELLSLQAMQGPQGADMTLLRAVIRPYLQNSSIVLLFFLPLLTMRGFSEEKRSGTFELLLSYPVSEAQLAWGKLCALGAFLLAALALHALGPALLFLFSAPEPLPVLTGYAGLFLLGLGFLSLGLFLSSLTRNQVTAAVLTFAALLLLWLLSWVEEMVPASASAAIAALSLLGHFENFARGVVAAEDLAYYAAFILGFFWLTVLSLENQRWRR